MSRTSHNLIYLLVSQVATWSVTLVVLLVAPRYLGPDGFGKLGFATAFIGFFTLAASLGTATYLTRSIARDRSMLGSYVYNAVVLKVGIVAVLAVVAVVLARLIGATGDTLILVVLGCFGMLFGVLNDVFVGTLTGLERMGRPAMWSTIQTYLASIGGVLILVAGGGVVLYGLAFAVTALVPLVANGRLVWPWTAGSRHVDLGVWTTLTRGGFPLMILSGLTLLYGTIDIPILTNLAGDTTVGWYTLAYRFVGIPVFIATATVYAFFPSFSAHGTAVSGEFVRLVNRALRLVVQVSVPAAAGIVVISDDLIDFLYGSRYEEAVPVMRILATHVPLAAMGFVLGSALVASNRQNRYLVVAGLAAILNPAAAFVLIHWAIDRHGNGAIGAAIATVVTELFVSSGALVLRSRGVMDKATVGFVLRTGVAGGAMAAIVWAVDGLALPVRIVIGIAVYVAASTAVRTITPGDIRRVVNAFTGAAGSVRNRPQPAP